MNLHEAISIIDEADKFRPDEAHALWAMIFNKLGDAKADENFDLMYYVVENAKAPSPEIMAQLMMEVSPLSEKIRNWKLYALRMMKHMGPDYIASFNHLFRFIKKADEF